MLKKMDPATTRRIFDCLDRIAGLGNIRSTGKALKGDMGALWRYRVGDYRIICDINDDILRVLVVKVGHRREVYR